MVAMSSALSEVSPYVVLVSPSCLGVFVVATCDGSVSLCLCGELIVLLYFQGFQQPLMEPIEAPRRATEDDIARPEVRHQDLDGIVVGAGHP